VARTPDISITDADRAVLGPLAEHRILIVPQVAVLLGVTERTAARRLRDLHKGGLVRYEPVFQGTPAAARITSKGIKAIEHNSKAPSLNLNEYGHDVGVGWLWLAARGGAFGEVTRMAAEREMKATDGPAFAAGRRAIYGVGLGLFGSNGRPEHHYPDLVLEMASGHRVAVELELTQKSARRMRRIMSAYASDGQIDAVVYVVPTKRLADLVTDSARRAGIGDIVHVQRLAPNGIAGARTRTVQRAQARTSMSLTAVSPGVER
jgi:hypothetical protein